MSGKSGKVSEKCPEKCPEKCHKKCHEKCYEKCHDMEPFGNKMSFCHNPMQASNSLMMKNLIQSKFYLSLITAGMLSGIDCNDLVLYSIASSRI